jgi:hypothetical protein
MQHCFRFVLLLSTVVGMASSDSVMKVMRPPVAKSSLPCNKKRALEAAAAAPAATASSIELLVAEKAEINLRFVDAVVVIVEDEAFTDAVDEKSKALMSLPGIYWKIGDLGGKQCFRQESLPEDELAPNGKELFLWHSTKEGSEGWFWTPGKPLLDKGAHVAWAKNQAGADLPDALHVPFWAKKPAAGVEIMLLHHYAAWKLKAAQLQQDELEATVANLQGQILCFEALKAMPADVVEFNRKDEKDESHKGKGQGGKPDDGYKAKGSGKNKGAPRSGWLNKCRELTVEVIDQNFGNASRLARSYAVDTTMTALLPSRIVKQAQEEIVRDQ